MVIRPDFELIPKEVSAPFRKGADDRELFLFMDRVV